MGKQGPCCHCGVASTPLWRNGPPEKPVLCNACGSRWRTKGTLANYTPLHARADADDYEDHRVSKMKSISLKKKDEKLSKRKLSYESNVGGRFADHNHSFQKSIDEDTGYRSSSGSAISNSESCAHFGSVEASDLTGPAQSIAWEAQVPSRKRTCVTRPKQSSVEKLTRDLHTILHEQQSSYLSGSSEEDLLFESDTPMVSVEIGHGSVLMKHPSSLGREEESEASSLSFENKHCAANEVYSHSTLFTRYNDCKGQENHFHDSERFKKLSGHMRQPEPVKRDKPIQERTQQLWHRNSPLCSLDLNDVVNVEVLVEYFTREEQQQLLKYLPSDTSPDHDSLRSMFECRYFKEDLSSFQQLVSEGIFSNNFSGVDVVDFKTLKKLILSNLTKTKWLELYNKLKGNRSTVGIGECSYTGASGSKSSFLETSWNAKKLHNIEDQDVPGVKLTIKSPSRAVIKNRQQETKESSETNGLFFSPKSLFMTMPREDGGLLMLDSNRFGNESSDQDILLDVPSNCSFPEAEFLLPTSSFAPQRPSAGSSSTHPLSHP